MFIVLLYTYAAQSTVQSLLPEVLYHPLKSECLPPMGLHDL